MRLSGIAPSRQPPGRGTRGAFGFLLAVVTAWPALGQNPAQDIAADTWRLESRGEAGQALERLREVTAPANASPDALRTWAEFLERQHDPAARQAYERLAQALQRVGAPREQRSAVARQLAILDLETGDRAAATRALNDYSSVGGTGLSLPSASDPPALTFIEIPGPLRSFARMSALSPELALEDVLPALARNVVTNGYQAANSNEALEQTEYLKLVIRYLSQARELEKVAGPGKIIKIDTCDSTATGDVLRVIGYRMRGGCGSDVVLETINASRAFLTTDSGFPLAELEQALRTNRPFTLDYHPSRVPVLYGAEYWQSAKDKTQGEFIDYYLSDPSLCRLYLGLSKLDPETADGLRKAVPAPRLKLYAHVLDFFGGMFEIRDGKAIVPGGARSEKTWSDLAGVDPARGAAFFERLISRDDGWLASYFDALARIQGPARDYLTEPERLKRFYLAIRGRVTSPGPARPVFRSNTDMMLLTARLHIDPDGKPHLPGSLDVWKNLFVNHPQGKYDAKLSKAAGGWKDSEDVLEALFGLARKVVENEPLKIFMALSDIDRNRPRPLESATMDRLAREYRTMSAQYPLFAESPTLSDKTILSFMDTAHATSSIRDQALRADVAGTLQALTGLWQIFVRQGSIRPDQADTTLAEILTPFAKVQNEREVFDGGQSGVRTLLTATGSDAKASAQDRMIDLLAGTGSADNSIAHERVIEDMIRVFESQRLAPLSTLFDLADNLDSVGRGEKLNTALAGRLATRISEIQLPRSAMTGTEKNSMAFGYWTERHIDSQRKMNLRASIDKAAADANKLKELRGQLAPFLRDTLVGFVYIHYAPPGAQVLHTNPLFVRSHDFIGIQGADHTWKETTVFGTGWPANAGGRLVGSLASLPYALAEAEQNFLIPTQQQALIWGDLVPQIIQTAVIPRWWNVSPTQIHWVGLHMAYGESLLAESAIDNTRRAQVLDALARYAAPVRLKKVEQLLVTGDVRGAVENVLPSELYLVASGLASAGGESPLAAGIRRLAAESPEITSPKAISRVFGTPKPTLANTYQPELLNLRTFPTLMGYSSRILAESWESNLLYYAALADEIHARPAEMNVLVPEWTQATVEQIFATHLEDWPALLRSLRLVGEDVRQKARKQEAQVAN
jgi:hypothetical protein